MFDAAAVGEIQKPSTKEPFELALVLMVIAVGKKVGVTENVVPTNASEVTANVWEPVTPLWKPIPENVATPVREVVVVEVMFVVTPAMVCCSTEPFAAVIVTC
jgi:hypothetical protein